jgi:hypothetical protein
MYCVRNNVVKKASKCALFIDKKKNQFFADISFHKMLKLFGTVGRVTVGATRNFSR